MPSIGIWAVGTLKGDLPLRAPKYFTVETPVAQRAWMKGEQVIPCKVDEALLKRYGYPRFDYATLIPLTIWKKQARNGSPYGYGVSSSKAVRVWGNLRRAEKAGRQ